MRHVTRTNSTTTASQFFSLWHRMSAYGYPSRQKHIQLISYMEYCPRQIQICLDSEPFTPRAASQLRGQPPYNDLRRDAAHIHAQRRGTKVKKACKSTFLASRSRPAVVSLPTLHFFCHRLDITFVQQQLGITCGSVRMYMLLHPPLKWFVAGQIYVKKLFRGLGFRVSGFRFLALNSGDWGFGFGSWWLGYTYPHSSCRCEEGSLRVEGKRFRIKCVLGDDPDGDHHFSAHQSGRQGKTERETTDRASRGTCGS